MEFEFAEKILEDLKRRWVGDVVERKRRLGFEFWEGEEILFETYWEL